MNELYDPLNGFQSRKAAQIAAFFACLAGGTIEKLKLIKLFYLAEREFMNARGRPMLYDEFYSLKDGPICSATLNGMNGMIDAEIWSSYIARNGNIVTPVRKVSRDALDEVSNAEFQIINHIWTRFGHMSASQIRNYTHEHCPEYRLVLSGRSPITYAEIFHAVGSQDPAALAAAVENFREYDSAIQDEAIFK